MKQLQRLFLNDRFILAVILLNVVLISISAYGVTSPWLLVADNLCTTIFLIEMLVKFKVYGFRSYWSRGWNRFDGSLVLLSLPALIAPFLPEGMVFNPSVLLTLRLLRVLRFFRLFHFFPNFGQIMAGFRLAMKSSYAVFIAFFIFIFAFALISCELFRTASPEYFGTPTEAVYSIFRLCTVEGWYEIPDAITAGMSEGAAAGVRIYFAVLLIFGGIIGLSLVNSIFVDAMVADNNDDVKYQLQQMEHKIDILLEELEKAQSRTTPK